MAILERGDTIFPQQAAEGSDDLWKGNAGKTKFSGLVEPQEDNFCNFFADITFDKDGRIEKNLIRLFFRVLQE